MKKYLASLAALSLLTLGLMPASALGQAPPPPSGSSNQQDDPYAGAGGGDERAAAGTGRTGRRPRQLHSRRRFLPARRQRRLGRGDPKFSHLSRRSRGDRTEFPRGTSTRLRQYSAHVHPAQPQTLQIFPAPAFRSRSVKVSSPSPYGMAAKRIPKSIRRTHRSTRRAPVNIASS